MSGNPLRPGGGEWPEGIEFHGLLDRLSDVDNILRRQSELIERQNQLLEAIAGGRPPPTDGDGEQPVAGEDVLAVLRDVRAFLAAETTTFPDEVDLPVGEVLPGERVATAAEDISGGELGDAYIVLNGAEFLTEVRPNQNVDPNDKLKTTGEGRTVEVIEQERGGASGTSISGTGLLSDRTEVAGLEDGDGNIAAATVGPLGNVRKDFDVPYKVTTDGVLHVEHSLTGKEGDWLFHTDIDTNNSGTLREDTLQFETALNHVRVYPDDGNFADTDVDFVVLAAKGV